MGHVGFEEPEGNPDGDVQEPVERWGLEHGKEPQA